jgi:hypothetical protein
MTIYAQTGDVVNMKSFRAEEKTANGNLSMSFSAGRGNEFVFLLLGKEVGSEKLKPEIALMTLGWFPGLDSDDARALIKAHKREIAKHNKANSLVRPKITYDSRVENLEWKIKKLEEFAGIFDMYMRT